MVPKSHTTIIVLTRWENKQDNGERRFIHEYSGKYEAQMTSGRALVQISSTNRQQITNNSSNSSFSTARRLSAYQLAQRTKLLRDSRRSNTLQRRSNVSAPTGFIPFPTGCDVT
ncbi:hypothetical protein AVEN_106508-1 [Araneus ventricosus]|uniref:Uncharacterized protein n=1 Tax=Araneus ventricosus TaxID=182803 RepID=A0A4Y2FN26_ARAVE|nr:hypothetical protein AVEN_61112-1 [Araneus ventricosus]GBM41898.1 hypothetical protein AVEN_106508-1 [Araneus ventricosus]